MTVDSATALRPTRTSRRTLAVRAGLVISFLAVAALALHASPVKRHALRWVSGACQMMEDVLGTAWPCLAVSSTPEGRGIVVLKAPFEDGHVLVVPTQRILGLESPEMMGAAGADYLNAAWRVREQAAPEGMRSNWDMFGLAINGPWNRTQDQLHIHVECLTPRAAAAFEALRGAPADRWTALPDYRWMWVKRWPHPDFTGLDFRRDLYDAVPIPPERDASRINLGAAGLLGPNGEREFVLIHSLGRSIERFLDPACE